MDNEQPHQELVKCVVVGDTAVGKTRLICARACNKQVSLSQLINTHIPTVWAIDQYRIYKEVLERSWLVVDGVNVSLRLWDTFGDHDKDRRFAYGRSDVVLLCFSITNPTSLRNCRVMWYPEIRRFCPNTPIVLVGCKNDLRYMYTNETYLSHCKDRSPFVRPVRECDILSPDQGRAIARDIGAPYYEASVLSYHGVGEVFENVIRAALIERRRQRFWMTNLKKVQRPLLQVPFCPPKPPAPVLHNMPSTYEDDLLNLLQTQAHTDVIFRVGDIGFPAHKFVLCASVPKLHQLFMMDLSTDLIVKTTRSSSDSSMVSTMDEASVCNFNTDTEQAIADDSSSTRSSTVALINPASAWDSSRWCPSARSSPAHSIGPFIKQARLLFGSSSPALRLHSQPSATFSSSCSLASAANSSSPLIPSDGESSIPRERKKRKASCTVLTTDAVIHETRSCSADTDLQLMDINQNPAGDSERTSAACNITYNNNNNNSIPMQSVDSATIDSCLSDKQDSQQTYSTLLDIPACEFTPVSVSSSGVGISHELNHSAYKQMQIQQCDGLDHRGKIVNTVQTIVTLSTSISAAAMHHCLQFLYTGAIDRRKCKLEEVGQAATLLEWNDLRQYVANIENGEDYLNAELQLGYMQRLKNRLKEQCVDNGFFSDVLFKLDDGTCAAHRPMLMCRCDMMYAMFSGDFRESIAKVVHFPGVKRETFYQLLYYLYVDECPMVRPLDCVELVELANRLCLPRLMSLLETNVSYQLQKLGEASGNATEQALALLEPCQLHNSDQLADWCMHHIATNYNTICREAPKLLRNLHPENQAYLNRHRWPPVWYLKEFDYYERCRLDREREEHPLKSLKRHRSSSNSSNSSSGCLCFSSKSRRNSDKLNYCTI